MKYYKFELTEDGIDCLCTNNDDKLYQNYKDLVYDIGTQLATKYPWVKDDELVYFYENLFKGQDCDFFEIRTFEM